MASHTISAKYIPNTSLDYFNSLLNGVEQKTADGSLVTFHLESFSCRMSRADKQHFENQRKEHTNENNNNNNSMGNTTYNGSTPNVTPYAVSAVTPKQPLYNDDYDNDFRFDNEPPTSSQSQQNGTFPAFNAHTAAFFTNESSAQNAAAPSSHFGNTPPTSPQIGLGIGSSTSLSPQTLTASAAQSGRPCFPEFFVIPNDLRSSSHLSSTVASPMGYPYGSTSSGVVGGAGDGEEGISMSEDLIGGTNQQQQPQQQQPRQLSANWYGLTSSNNPSGGSDSTNGGANSGSQQQAFNASSNRPNNNNNNSNGTFPPSFRLPDSDNTLQQTSTVRANPNPNAPVGAAMGGRSASNGGSNNSNPQLQNPSSPFPQNQQQQQQQFYVPATREEAYVLNQKIISDRLIYLVGALNSLYGTAEYDFSVLSPTDFVLVNPISFISEVTSILGELPADVLAYTGQHGESLWRAIGSMIGGETSLYDSSTNMSECDVFLLNCPSCDPTSQTKLWSSHYFIYHKKNKVIISLIIFGEAANKRGGGGGGILGGFGGGGGSGMHSAESAGLLSALGLGADAARRGNSNSAGGGEYYIDSYGNTHFIGGDGDDDDGIDGGGGAERRRRQVEGGGWSSPYPMSPTSAGVSYGGDETDTPQYVQASSMTDVNSEWGNDDAM